MSSTKTPAAFLGHGTPMNALDDNRYTQAWHCFGASLVKPRAVLVVSAHWYIGATAVTAMAKPKTIHDFYGFPQALFDIQYPAVGAPDVAREVAETLKPIPVGFDQDSWGIDHGAWSVLLHVFPKADVPVLQLSINAAQSFDYHFDIGAKLAPLRDKGIMILCSGNVVHNLQRIDWQRADAAFDWNRRFDGVVREVMTTRPADLRDIIKHEDYRLAAPTPEHFIPLLYLAGLAHAEQSTAQILIEGFAMGSLSMTAYSLGADCPTKIVTERGAPPLDASSGTQSNI